MNFVEMTPVIVESPFKGDRVRNKRYLESCLRDCVYRKESPYASHKLLTDCLDDDDPTERHLGISAGIAWRKLAKHVFYVDLGWSEGMLLARAAYDKEGIEYEIRNLPADAPYWKDAAPPLSILGPATRTFLLDAVNEKIDEWELAETDCVQRIERMTTRKRAAHKEDTERLEAIKTKLDHLRAVVKELS